MVCLPPIRLQVPWEQSLICHAFGWFPSAQKSPWLAQNTLIDPFNRWENKPRRGEVPYPRTHSYFWSVRLWPWCYNTFSHGTMDSSVLYPGEDLMTRRLPRIMSSPYTLPPSSPFHFCLLRSYAWHRDTNREFAEAPREGDWSPLFVLALSPTRGLHLPEPFHISFPPGLQPSLLIFREQGAKHFRFQYLAHESMLINLIHSQVFLEAKYFVLVHDIDW